ncbi:hypothetical protein B0O99DRAFT_593963 [Bisporella sp. PMI_857]|nr:hypothetical protein B0O99DRAFT_593963 [Bisporella sp. PMI_857]
MPSNEQSMADPGPARSAEMADTDKLTTQTHGPRSDFLSVTTPNECHAATFTYKAFRIEQDQFELHRRELEVQITRVQNTVGQGPDPVSEGLESGCSRKLPLLEDLTRHQPVFDDNYTHLSTERVLFPGPEERGELTLYPTEGIIDSPGPGPGDPPFAIMEPPVADYYHDPFTRRSMIVLGPLIKVLLTTFFAILNQKQIP